MYMFIRNPIKVNNIFKIRCFRTYSRGLITPKYEKMFYADTRISMIFSLPQIEKWLAKIYLYKLLFITLKWEFSWSYFINIFLLFFKKQTT